MQPDDYTQWIAALSSAVVGAGAAVFGVGAWLWRLASLDQKREERIKRLEEWRQAHMLEYQALLATLRQVEQNQAVQNESLKNICRSLDELRDDQRIIMGERREGGGRCYDPPARGGA